MVSFNLITGFLGSGKTTFLANVLKDLAPEKRVAVIQNEFASTGVDGKELQQQASGFKLIEINNGSVFCVCQLNNFTQTLQNLISNYKPELIFLEASGLADPISVVELLQTDDLKDIVSLDKIISLVDAPNFFRGLSSLVRFKHQIMVADKIILNKMDLYEDNLDEINQAIEKLNPFAEIIPTSYAQIPWDKLDVFSSLKSEAAIRYIGTSSEGRPDILACVLRTHDKLAESNFSAFINELQKDCIRMKGFLNLKNGKVVSFHSVFEQQEIKILENYIGPSELIVFGSNMTITHLRKLYKLYCNL
jgi:G3E family GTPase